MPKSNTASEKESLRWLLGQLRPARNWICAAVGLGFAGGMLLVAQAAFLANLIQGIFMDGLPRQVMLPSFAGLAAVVVLRAAAAWGREVAGFMSGAKVREEVRSALMKHLAELGPFYSARQRTGELASAVLEQVEGLNGFFSLYLPQLALAVLIPAAILAFTFPVSWAAGLILLLTAPLIPLFTVLVGMGAESISQRNFQALARLSAHFLDVLQGLSTLKLFDRSKAAADAVGRASADYRRQTMRVLRVAFLSSAVLEFFTSVSIALVAVYLGMHYLGYLQFGDWGAPLDLRAGFFILLLAPDFFVPLRELGTHYHARADAVGAAAEIRRVLSAPAAPGSPLAAPLRVADFKRIRFDSVHLAYDGGRRPALSGVSFELQAGEQVALAGASGAGKTSILNLLMGFVRPDGGRILIDGTPLERLLPEDWHKLLTWIGQSPVLFHGTIRENILLGRPDAGPSALEQAALSARVSEFCRQLPLGLDTPVGERGIGLSRGQAQRVALARAFLKSAPLLLLDEPTAGLDTENEELVLAAIQSLAAHRTVLTVTHRLEAMQGADRILVLADGCIAEQGTYSQLSAAGGLLARLNMGSAGEVSP